MISCHVGNLLGTTRKCEMGGQKGVDGRTSVFLSWTSAVTPHSSWVVMNGIGRQTDGRLNFEIPLIASLSLLFTRLAFAGAATLSLPLFIF